MEPRFPTLQTDSLPAEPPGKPRILEWVVYLFSADLPDPGIEPESPTLQLDSLPVELLSNPSKLRILNLLKFI